MKIRWVLLVVAVVLAIGTAVVIVVSSGDLRSGFALDHIMRRLDRLGTQGDYGDSYQESLRDAVQYARRPGDWIRLMRLAWDLPEPERWTLVRDLSGPAIRAMPRDHRWRIIGAYAAVRRGFPEEALELLMEVNPAGPVAQRLMVLAALDAPADQSSMTALEGLVASREELELPRRINAALRGDSSAALLQAGEETGVSAFFIQRALRAAQENDRETVDTAIPAVRRAAGSDTARLLLASWTNDDEWFFRLLRELPPREAVSPAVLTLRGETLLRAARIDEARTIYQELRTVAPLYHVAPFFNEAIIRMHRSERGVTALLQDGLHYHPESHPLLYLAATRAAREGRREEARSMVQRVVAGHHPATPQWPLHEAWLLDRILEFRSEGSGAGPLERLQSDLWRYLNSHEDAHQAAAFLARILLARRDTAGLRELQRRYAPQDAPWARTVFIVQQDPHLSRGEMEELMRSGTTWHERYNRALFALRHLGLPEARDEVAALRRWHERQGTPAPPQQVQREVDILMLEAELQRLLGDTAAALDLVDRAISQEAEREILHSYRALLAGVR